MKDKHLVNRARSGDKSSFEKLVRRYYDTVRLLAFSIFQNRDDAEEVAQEVFLKAYILLEEVPSGKLSVELMFSR
ncbi:hypothetical protein J7M22_11420 [Candidatus Poribacteria bacterium]|nr:hypothetical protein [Candidatus Poribacteria bacterium]